MKNLLQEFIQLSLQESTRADREGVKLPSEYDQIEKYVDKGCFIHLGQLNKLGVNPHSQYNETPNGIYGYPLTNEIFNQFKNDKLPFADKEKYIHIFSARNPEKIITLQDMTKEDCLKRVNELLRVSDFLKQHKSYDDLLRGQVNFSRFTPPGYVFWKMSNYISSVLLSRNSKEWAHLLRKIGIDGIIDMGGGIIFDVEPTQAVFFSKDSIQHLETFWNPKNKKVKERSITHARIVLKKEKTTLQQYEILYNYVQKLKNEGLKISDIFTIGLSSFIAKISSLIPTIKDEISMHNIINAYDSLNLEQFLEPVKLNYNRWKSNLKKTNF